MDTYQRKGINFMANYIYNSGRVAEILSSGVSDGLDDLVELEDILAYIKEQELKQEFYEKQKKSRIKLIDDEINKIEQRNNFLRLVAFNTLKKHKEKSVSFPSVGKIGIKNAPEKNKWVIKDENNLIKILKENLSKEELEKRNLIKTEEKISKSNLNETLDEWSVNGSYMELLKDIVLKEEKVESLSVKHDKDLISESSDEEEINVKPKNIIKEVKNNNYFDEIDDGEI